MFDKGLNFNALYSRNSHESWTLARRVDAYAFLVTIRSAGIRVMPNFETALEGDVWSNWLLQRRSGGSALRQATAKTDVAGFIEKLLDGIQMPSGATLVDVGCGEGDVAFAAIRRFGPSLRAVFVDVSEPLLRLAQAHAETLGFPAQCVFVANSADQLVALADDSADALTTRSSLAYVRDKRAALAEFLRVLKPGAVLSIAEPVMQDEALEVTAFRQWLEQRGTAPSFSFLPLLLRWRAAQFPSTVSEAASNPLTNYSERDLLSLVQEVGFIDTHLELHIDITAAQPVPWPVFLASAPHPWAPTAEQIFDEQFDAAERLALEEFLRPLIEAGVGCVARRIVYISARKRPGRLEVE